MTQRDTIELVCTSIGILPVVDLQQGTDEFLLKLSYLALYPSFPFRSL